MGYGVLFTGFSPLSPGEPAHEAVASKWRGRQIGLG